MTDARIGARIAGWRRRRGISQVALAGLVGRSESWLSQVERGQRDVDSLRVLRDLARVLRVGLDDLAPGSAPGTREHAEPAHAAVERALLAPGSADPTTASRVAAAHGAYQAARLSGDRADLGMAVFQVVCALLPTERPSLAEDLATSTAAAIGGDDDAVRSVAGALWLIAALAAARRGDRAAAAERLDCADHLANALGRDANLRWTAFGPTNVVLHRVSVAAEMGDAPAALSAARTLDVERFSPALRSRRVQVGLDIAWAHACRRHDADAILALLDVERDAPDVTRHNVYARSTISTLLGRARGATRGHVRSLAARSGLAL